MENNCHSDFHNFLFMLGYANEYMPAEHLGEMFHYTSPNGLISILTNDPSKATIWASRYDCLNDTSEGTVAISVYQEVCETLKEQNILTQNLYNALINIKPTYKAMFRSTKNTTDNFSKLECSRFLCSFSKNNDSLAMWNYYSKNNQYEGFNICFDSSFIRNSLLTFLNNKNTNFHIYPIIYSHIAQKELVTKFLQAVIDHIAHFEANPQLMQSTIEEQLTLWELVFKNEYFQHEQEVRIIIDVAKNSTSIPIQLRYNAGCIIPYIELKLDKETVSSVNFAPSLSSVTQKERQATILAEELASHGYHINVWYSNIPIRY